MIFIVIGTLLLVLLVIFVSAVGCLVGAIGWGIIEGERKTGYSLLILSLFLFWLFFLVMAWMVCAGS